MEILYDAGFFPIMTELSVQHGVGGGSISSLLSKLRMCLEKTIIDLNWRVMYIVLDSFQYILQFRSCSLIRFSPFPFANSDPYT